VSKIIEKLVHKRVFKFLEKYSVLYKMQFGFRKNHSTKHALIDVTEKLKNALDSGDMSMGIYLDLKKAFDTVDHSILLRKLHHYGIRGHVNKWFESYLTDRRQFVQIEGSSSPCRNIDIGVPQGSVLGPLLYILYVNDIANSIVDDSRTQLMLFADDTNVILHGNDINELKINSENVLQKLYVWLCCNKLTLNVAKTNFCIFHRTRKKLPIDCDKIKFGCEYIQRVSNVRYLGMMIDDKLEWKCHFENLYKNLVKRSSTFKFIKNYVPHKCKKQLYYAYVYSRIIYGVEIYGAANKYLLNKLQRLQSKILKILYNKDWYTPTNDLHKSLSVLKVDDIMKLFVLKFVHACKTGEIPDIFKGYYRKRNEIHNLNTRNKDKFEIPLCKSVYYGQRSLKYIGAKLYNELPSCITNSANHKLFISRTKNYFLSNY